MGSYWQLLRSGELSPEQIAKAAKVAAEVFEEKETMKKGWTEQEKRAIAENPDLPEEVAAAFAEELEQLESLTPETDPSLPEAQPGSIQELFPHLRNPRYV